MKICPTKLKNWLAGIKKGPAFQQGLVLWFRYLTIFSGMEEQ
jgi:hypothetical protein